MINTTNKKLILALLLTTTNKKLILALLTTTLCSSCVNNRVAIPENDGNSDMVIVIQYKF
jgi:hypothetical protein